MSLVEVIVVLAILGLFVLLGAMIVPRRREAARSVRCQRNLMQIGIALALYDQNQGALPVVPELGGVGPGSGPLAAMIAEFGIRDFTGLTDAGSRPPKSAVATPVEGRRVPGFVCTSDPHAIGNGFRAPVSYRATTGDAADGQDGAFAPGRRIAISAIEAADGAGYTAAFSERLVGDNRSEHGAPNNYAETPGPIVGPGCPRAGPAAWRGDAGAAWVAADWQSTLYNHALTPNATPSCIADDRRTALMGASSGHVEGVNVLLFDGGVRTFTPRVDPKVWRGWATVPTGPSETPASPRPTP